MKRIINRLRHERNRFLNRLKIYQAAAVTLLTPTKKGLWKKVAEAGPPSWDERNQIIAGFIPPGSSVLDVGCGAQTLKQYLKPGCRYQPCDVVKSSPDVIFCDFNAGIYPNVGEPFDYIVCSGVFEYIRKPEEFLRRIPLLGHFTIMSYNPLPPGGSKLARLANGWGWLNHFTNKELEDLFEGMGLSWTILLGHEKLGYTIFLLSPEKMKRENQAFEIKEQKLK
ncbi:MAG TPA: methyltransferase domain-containing protein [Verrucomicrobiae bacterium]|jgi:hypothetical protein